MVEESKHIEVSVNPNGNTNDIVETVIHTYNKDYKQVKKLAKSLESESIYTTCNEVFNFIINEIEYKEDPSGVQWVKTPARLFSDKLGDCKSMSIFSASILRCLNIPHAFRFTSYTTQKEPTHVYVVAFDGDNEIIIDPVVRIDNKPKFNYEQKITHKTDIMGTHISYLAGIGANQNEPVWFGNDPARDLTRSELDIYVNLHILDNEYNTAVKDFGENSQQASRILDRMDLAMLAIYGLENYVGEDLEEYFSAIRELCDTAQLSFSNISINTVDLTDRKLHFEKNKSYLIDNFYKYEIVEHAYNWIKYETGISLYENFFNSLGWVYPTSVGANDNFGIWKKNIQKIGASSTEYDTARNNIVKSIEYYACTLIPSSELSQYPQAAQNKRDVHIKLLNNWHMAGFMSLEQSASVIVSEVKRKYNVTPAGFLNLIKNSVIAISGVPHVNSLTAVIGVVSAISSVLGFLKKLFGSSKPDLYNPDEATIKYNVTNPTDLGGTGNYDYGGFPGGSSGSTSNSLTSYLPYIGLGILAIFLLSSNGKKKNK